MAVTYLIHFDVVPEQRERFLDLLNGVLDAMRDEPMFHHAVLQEDPENQHRFMLSGNVGGSRRRPDEPAQPDVSPGVSRCAARTLDPTTRDSLSGRRSAPTFAMTDGARPKPGWLPYDARRR